MADSRYKEHILETIDQLRKRKARPDLDRICHMVERRYGCSPQQTRAQMERLVEAEVVIKVDYKGNTSYRNAAKWGKKAGTNTTATNTTVNNNNSNNSSSSNNNNNGVPTQRESAGERAKEVRRCLIDAVTSITSARQQAPSAVGASVRDIERYLVAHNSSVKLVKTKLQVALEREASANQLVKLKNGNYAVYSAPTIDKTAKPVVVVESNNNNNNNNNNKKRSAPAVNNKDEDRGPADGVVTTPSVTPKKSEAEKTPTEPRQSPSNGVGRGSGSAAVTCTSPPPPPPQAPTSFPRSVHNTSVVGGPRGRAEEIMGSPSKKGRPSSNKRKRFKKTHGPDFVENYDSSFEEPEPKCDYCLLTAAYNYHGKPEELLFCKDCNAKAHPSCMDYSADLAMRSRMSPWQCMDCKTCFVCDDSGDADSMLFCDACDKGYHMGCHTPKINEKPSGKWVCVQCSGERKKRGGHHHNVNNSNTSNGINGIGNSVRKPTALEPVAMVVDVEPPTVNVGNQTVDGTPGLPTPCESPVPEGEQNKRMFNFIFHEDSLSDVNKENSEVPDASDWSIQDVEDYFRSAGFPEQATAFRDQEIDGKSLLLLKRSDVLTGLSIKLGPALKIYNHVKCLQTRRVDGHLIG